MQEMLDFLSYFFLVNPSASGVVVVWILALVFGAIWLACYRPPLLTRPWLWAVLAGGAILAPIAITVAAYPLKAGIAWVYSSLCSQATLMKWALLTSIPSMYFFCLVREGFKLLPVVIYWWCKGRDIEPKLGLAAGAASGAGFGILESQWMLNYVLASGWSWENVQMYGLVALSGFWESFFMVGVNVATCALAGWGLAKKWGWQFYLLAAFVYVVMNYMKVLVDFDIISSIQGEFFIAAWALMATGVALWLRERKSKVSG